MEKFKVFLSIGLVIFSLIAFSFQQVIFLESPNVAPQDTSSNYLDGLYTGHSRSIYFSEPYWGHVRIEITNGTFTDIYFVIRDSSRHENVDSLYGINHYTSNPAYQQQCVNDGHGIEIYPQQLLESQNLDNIDCIGGATWSCKIFIASVKEALKEAHKITIVESNTQNKFLVKAEPNPFNSTVKIEYFLQKNSSVSLSIYNGEGKLTKQLINQVQKSGHHSVNWNDCTAEGVYYYRLLVDKNSVNGILVKINK